MVFSTKIITPIDSTTRSISPSVSQLSKIAKFPSSWSKEGKASHAWEEDCRIQRRAIFHHRFHHERKRRRCTHTHIYIYVRMKYSSSQALTHVESHGWVEQFEPPMFSDDGDTFLTILPKRQRDGTYWRHAVAITNVSSASPRKTALTSGRFVVTEIVSWDQKKSYLWVCEIVFLFLSSWKSIDRFLEKINSRRIRGFFILELLMYIEN